MASIAALFVAGICSAPMVKMVVDMSANGPLPVQLAGLACAVAIGVIPMYAALKYTK